MPENSDKLSIIHEKNAKSLKTMAANEIHRISFGKICQDLEDSRGTYKRFKRFYNTEEFTGCAILLYTPYITKNKTEWHF